MIETGVWYMWIFAWGAILQRYGFLDQNYFVSFLIGLVLGVVGRYIANFAVKGKVAFLFDWERP